MLHPLALLRCLCRTHEIRSAIHSTAKVGRRHFATELSLHSTATLLFGLPARAAANGHEARRIFRKRREATPERAWLSTSDGRRQLPAVVGLD